MVSSSDRGFDREAMRRSIESVVKDIEKLVAKLANLPVSISVIVGGHDREHRGYWDRYRVIDEGDAYRIVVELPGARKDGIELYASEKSVFVKAVNEVEAPSLPRVYRVRIDLDEEIDPGTARAKYFEGLLTIEVKKQVKGRRIEIE